MVMTSLWVTFDTTSDRNVCVFNKYFKHFLDEDETVRLSRSHTKPTYVTDEAKSWPLTPIRCHGTPSGSVIARMEEISIE